MCSPSLSSVYRFYACSCEIRRQGACTAGVDYASFFYERTHHVSYQRDAHMKYSRACIIMYFFRKQHSCARLAPTTQHQRDVRTRTSRQPPGVVLWVIWVEADLHQVYCCIICCTLSTSCFLHITIDCWCRLFSSYLYVRITLRAMLTWNTLELA